MRGLGFKEGGCGGVWVLGIVLEGDRTFCRKGRSLFLASADERGWMWMGERAIVHHSVRIQVKNSSLRAQKYGNVMR